MTILPARTVGGIALGVMGTFINLPVALVMFLLTRAAEVIDNPSDQHFSMPFNLYKLCVWKII